MKERKENMREKAGQQAMEFILISSLVLLGSLIMLLAFSKNIAAFFSSDSAIAKTTRSNPVRFNSNTGMRYSQNYNSSEISSTPIYTDSNLSQYNVRENSDGSISFSVNSQTVNLPASVIQLQQTTGSSGVSDLIQDIANMINTYQTEFTGPVPITLSFGEGARSDTLGYHSVYTGTASAIQVGKHVLITQKDQACEPGNSSNTSKTCNYSGLYKISGTLNSSSELDNASVSVITDDKFTYTGTFNGSVDLKNGISITNGSFDLNVDRTTVNYDWKINCTTPANTFSI